MINYDKKVEKSILCSLINNSKLFFEVKIKKDDFYFEENQEIYRILENKKGKEVDILIISEELGSKNLKKIGGLTYLSSIMNSFIGTSTFKSYIKILVNKSIKRKIENAQKLNLSILENNEIRTGELLSQVQKNIMEINIVDKEDLSSEKAVYDLIGVQEEYRLKYEKGGLTIGIPCGIKKIDQMVDGLRKGHVWLIGAWASTGKSSFLLNILHGIIKETPTLLVSLEMSTVDITAKIIGIRHKISSQKVIKGIFNDSFLRLVEEGKSFVYDSKLKISTKYFKLEEIKMLIRREVYKNKIRVVAIDYVQNIVGEGMREYEHLTKVATDFQALARELEITIILLSQISNESAKGGGAGAGFKGSGAFEAVADLAIKLVRNKETEDINSPDVPLTIVVHKNRHGFTGYVDDYNLHLKSGKIVDKINF